MQRILNVFFAVLFTGLFFGCSVTSQETSMQSSEQGREIASPKNEVQDERFADRSSIDLAFSYDLRQPLELPEIKQGLLLEIAFIQMMATQEVGGFPKTVSPNPFDREIRSIEDLDAQFYALLHVKLVQGEVSEFCQVLQSGPVFLALVLNQLLPLEVVAKGMFKHLTIDFANVDEMFFVCRHFL